MPAPSLRRRLLATTCAVTAMAAACPAGVAVAARPTASSTHPIATSDIAPPTVRGATPALTRSTFSSEELGVARETLRQALRVLEGSGHIVVTRGTAGGAVVQDSAPDPGLALHELRARRDDLYSLVEFRVAIESSAASLAAARRTDSDLEALERAQSQLAVSTNKDESRRADTAFHLAVAAASTNPHLLSAIEDARAAMFDPVDLAAFDFVRESSHAQHEQMLEAIRAGDAEAAAEAMKRHLDHTNGEIHRLIEGS